MRTVPKPNIAGAIPLGWMLALMLSSALLGCWPDIGDTSARSASASTPASQQPKYFEAIWPPEAGKPGVHYRIPVEYMVKGSVYGTRERIDSFMVCFEMPGAMPCRPLPRITDTAKQKTEHSAVRERYRVVQITRETGGYEVRMRVRVMMSDLYGGPYGTGLYRNYDVAGLEQYSTGTCYTPQEMQTAEVQVIMAKRRDLSQSFPNCRLDTLGHFVSPPSVTEDDDGGYTYCMSTSCRFYFSIEGREANYEFSSRGKNLIRHGLENWREVIDPARDVIKQWIMRK